jgi:hypothetical protein
MSIVGSAARGRLRLWSTAAALALAMTASGTVGAVTASAVAATPGPRTSATATAASGAKAASTSGSKTRSKTGSASARKPAVAVRPAISLPEERQLAGGFVPLSPKRILDTRDGTGTKGLRRKVGQNPLALDVSQVTGNPSVTPTAVVLNVTVTNPTTAGFLAVYGNQGVLPSSSNLNFQAGQTVANQVVVPVDSLGMVSFYDGAGAADVIADVAGYYTLDKAASTYVADGPTRLLDTRNGTGTAGVKAPVGTGKSLQLQVRGVQGVPDAASAVVLNVTATNATSSSYLTVYPDGQPLPTASNINFLKGQTVPNLVVVPVGADGKVDFYNRAGTTDVIADIQGYYLPGAPNTGGLLHLTDLVTNRVLDTRNGTGTGGVKGPVGAGQSVSLSVVPFTGGPASAITAVVLNVTATNATSGSYLTVYPDGENVPTASNVNFLKGQTVPNLVVVPVGADGKVDFYNRAGTTDIVADVQGYFRADSGPKATTPVFTQSTADASSGAVPVNVTWSVSDTDPGATQIVGEIVIRQKGTTPDSYIGQPYLVDYASTGSVYEGATLVSGTATSANFSYSFAVPQYSGATTAVWTVSLLTAYENTTQQESILAGSALAGAGNTLTATTAPSTVTPISTDVDIASLSSTFPPYLYLGTNQYLSYAVNPQDYQSGLWKGSVTVSGPGGASATGSFEELNAYGYPYGTCQGDIHDAMCDAVILIPAGSPSGVWSVSSVSFTNNAGQTKVYGGLNESPVTATSNEVLSASRFTATPNPVNSWKGYAAFKTSMNISGARSGVSSVQLTWQGNCYVQDAVTPTHNADGSYSVSSTMMQSNNGHASTCDLAGVVIRDGAGDLALYGNTLRAPATGLTVGGVPDTTPPTATSAKLNITSVPQSKLSSASVYVAAAVTDPTAPVDSFRTALYDSTGTATQGGAFGGTTVYPDGTVMLDVYLPSDLAPGTYTVSFTVIDSGWLSTTYGGPTGKPVPGGPLQITVTAG